MPNEIPNEVFHESVAQYLQLCERAKLQGVLPKELPGVLDCASVNMRRMMFPTLMDDCEACEAIGYLCAVMHMSQMDADALCLSLDTGVRPTKESAVQI